MYKSIENVIVIATMAYFALGLASIAKAQVPYQCNSYKITTLNTSKIVVVNEKNVATTFTRAFVIDLPFGDSMITYLDKSKDKAIDVFFPRSGYFMIKSEDLGIGTNDCISLKKAT